MFTSHHITKLIADQRVAQLQAQAAPKSREPGERRLVRWAHRLTRAGSSARQPVSPRPPGLAPDTPER